MVQPRPYVWARHHLAAVQGGRELGLLRRAGHVQRAAVPRRRGAISKTVAVQNPLPGFRTVEVTGQLDNVRPNTEFFEAAAEGEPAGGVLGDARPRARASIRPTTSRAGQAWVTQLVNAVMQGPREQWMHTAIFITWDDWGGFYDHVRAHRGRRERLRASRARAS